MTTQQINSASIFRVKHDIKKLHQGSTRVHVYYNALKELWDKLSALQVSDTENNERVYQFLMGLDNYYANIRENILATKPLPPIEVVYSRIQEKETDRFLELCKKNAREYLGDCRRNPYGGSAPVSSREIFRDYDFGSTYRGLFAPSYGSGGFSFA